MVDKHVKPQNLVGKVTDIHSHVGVSIKAYANTEFPYCQSLEGLYYRQRLNRVDFGVVFPFSSALYFDIPTLVKAGRLVPAAQPLSAAPYAQENRMLFTEVFTFCPEYSDHFIPFVCIDPMREVQGQLTSLNSLYEEYPIYGIKVSPVGSQAPVASLLKEGEPLLDFAADHDLPLLIHVTLAPNEHYSQIADAFLVADSRPDLRFCFAHCVSFSKQYLERAQGTPNVWVDTAALKIQVQVVSDNSDLMALPPDRFESDYSDHVQVMRDLVAHMPQTILWGSDSPAYSYICRRLQGPGQYTVFRLKANYEDERAALDGLSPQNRELVSSENIIKFLFGNIKAIRREQFS